MTRKDYILLAQALHIAKPVEPINRAGYEPMTQQARVNQWNNDVHNIASKLKAENPRFQYDRFVDACEAGV